jgi:hypothetical protein
METNQWFKSEAGCSAEPAGIDFLLPPRFNFLEHDLKGAHFNEPIHCNFRNQTDRYFYGLKSEVQGFVEWSGYC